MCPQPWVVCAHSAGTPEGWLERGRWGNWAGTPGNYQGQSECLYVPNTLLCILGPIKLAVETWQGYEEQRPHMPAQGSADWVPRGA